MAKRKKAAKKKKKTTRQPTASRTARPKQVTIIKTVTKKATIGKAARGSAYYLKQAKDRLYSELAGLMVKKEKALKKSAKKKIQKRIIEARRKLNRLK